VTSLSFDGDSASIVPAEDRDAPAVFTCEHASERLPGPWTWPELDRRLLGTHWAYDLGAADLCRELAHASRAAAVLSRFSRLLADPNRAVDSPDVFRAFAEGLPVELNRAVTAEDRERRLALHRGYHEAADRAVEASTAKTLLAVHTFTPIYEGAARDVEVGVLFVDEERLAAELHLRFVRAGFRAALNEPYSGKDGLLYSVERHAVKHGRRPLELELRQDLAMDPVVRARVVEVVTRFLRETP